MGETLDRIPCIDLKGQHIQIKDEVFEAFEKVYAKTAFSGGSFVQEFEDNFAAFIGSEHAIGVGNGTIALHLAMLALEIGEGDEVIIPANTFIATCWGVSHAGATPVFVDCDADTWEIDASKIEAAITNKTKAVIGVHLYGQPFDIDAVKSVCDNHNLILIEDAAQAHGAKYNGTRIGTFGEMACYSFYPGKNLGACGEGGGITTDNESIKSKLHSLRNHGSMERYYHDEIGYNYRMGGLEGASLNIKLKYIESWNNLRQEVAKRYLTEINNPKIKMQHQPENVLSVFHLFVVTCENKDALEAHLKEDGIDPAYHYPVPCHLQKAYADLGYKRGDFPNSEYLASHCLSLPMYPELIEEEVSRVIGAVNSF
jgi:dTDP-4-amino-4,6-dideoxygalactose transaminase